MRILSGRPGNLPAELTSMVGRQEELARIGRLCERFRLVTVTGVAGVGKTRLALRAAAGLVPRFADGAWLVELSALDNGLLLPQTIADALPVVDQTSRPMIEVIAGYVADRELLLVLDTCEHLVAACAATAQALLDAAPGLRILATSRRPLDIPDQYVMTIDPLPVPDGDSGGPQDAVALLADRAAAAVLGFRVSEQNRADVARLCRRLEGLPLAIELAAARLAELPVSYLADRLCDRFALLGETGHEVRATEPPWHQALRTAIGWSHQLCSPAGRLLWARLSVFAGSFDARAAREVCGDDRPGLAGLPGGEIQELLDTLADASIVTSVPAGGARRYRMLDTIREYGAFWLRLLDEEDVLRQRHRDYFLAMARRGCAEWAGPDQVTWCERTIAEHADMRAAMDFCLAEPDGDTALDMAGCLGFLWRHCGFPRDGQRYLDIVLDLDPAPGPARTWALFARGSIAFAQGDLTAAGHWGELCAAAASQPGGQDPGEAIAAAAISGMSLAMRGELTVAAELLDAAPDEPVRNSRYKIAPLQVRLARLYAHVHMGEFTRARAVADELRADCRRYGERWVRAYADYLRAAVDLAQRDPRSAVKHARAALNGHFELHNSTGIAVVLDGLASAVMAAGDAEQAAWLLGLCEHFWHIVGSKRMDSPGLVAARQACEKQARDGLGDHAYQTAFQDGYDTDLNTGLAAALSAVDQSTPPL